MYFLRVKLIFSPLQLYLNQIRILRHIPKMGKKEKKKKDKRLLPEKTEKNGYVQRSESNLSH